MDSTNARRLFGAMRRLQSDDVMKTLAAAGNDPDAARSLWQFILSTNTTDERFRTALEWVLESVLVDYVTNRMESNDEFAVVIGRRITTILEAVGYPQDISALSENEGHTKTA